MTNTSHTNVPNDEASAQTSLPEGVTGTEDWFLTHAAMHVLVEAGDAVPLSTILPDFVHHLGIWWLRYSDGWIAIEEPGLNARLDRCRADVAGRRPE